MLTPIAVVLGEVALLEPPIAVEVVQEAVLLVPTTIEVVQEATCEFAHLTVCKSIEFVPLLFPHVAVLSETARDIPPVPFGTKATSIFVSAPVADRLS